MHSFLLKIDNLGAYFWLKIIDFGTVMSAGNR